nr:RES family NAD+ phosphorylase [Plastoroseomonas hellenica]
MFLTGRPGPPTASFPHGIKTEILEAGSRLIRIHHKDNGPIWFGPKLGMPPANRFDASGGEYRAMYAATSLDGAFVETVLHGRTKDRILTRANVHLRAWTPIETCRPLTLAKLYDDGLLWHGTDAGISASESYTASRRIALALHSEGPAVDGITYRSRHDNGELCFALFDRVLALDLKPDARMLFGDHPAEIEAMMRKYAAVFDDSLPVSSPAA